MVGFWDLVGTGIAPVSKKTAVKTLILVRLQFCSLISDDMGPSSIISPLVWQDVLKIKELLLFPHTTKFQLFASRYIIQDTNIWKYSIMPYGLRACELASRTGLNIRAQLSQSVLSTVCLQRVGMNVLLVHLNHKSYTLESGINVHPWINVAPGKIWQKE